MINYFNPQKGLQRARCRDAYDKVVNYGQQNPNVNDLGLWSPVANTPYDDINKNLKTLRAQSRALYMDGGIANGAIKTLVTNVIGTGLRLKVNLDNEALGISEEEAVKWSKDVEKRFELWAISKDCCISGLNNFYELQALNFLATLLNGDSFTVISYNDNAELTLNIIESDRISTPTNSIEYLNCSNDVVMLKNGNFIESGIEKTPEGRIIAVHISSMVQGAMGADVKWTRVAIKNPISKKPNVIVNFTAERPGQTRGVPFLSSTITLNKQLQEYIAADLKSTIINSSLGMIFHLDDMSDNPFLQQNDEELETFEQKQKRVSQYNLEKGTVLTLGKDDKVTFADPNKPRLSFESFTTTIAKFIGASLEIPSEILLKTFNSSYSASRAALNAHWEVVRNKRNAFILDFCQPIYELWLFQQISTGVIKAPGYADDPYKAKLWSGAMWIGSSLSSIDPLKEVNAAEKRVINGFSTRTKEAMEMTGTDYFNNAKLLELENNALLKGKEEGGEKDSEEKDKD